MSTSVSRGSTPYRERMSTWVAKKQFTNPPDSVPSFLLEALDLPGALSMVDGGRVRLADVNLV